MARSRCLASSGSWFLMLDHKLDFHLLNLFTREMILLPPLESIDGCPMEFVRTCDSKVWVTLNNENKANDSGRKRTSYTVSHLRIDKGVLWVDEESRDYLVVWNYDGLLAYHKKGDDDNNSWKVLEPLKNQQCVDMVCKESKLYVLSDTRVTVLDFSRDGSPIKCASFKSLDCRRSFFPKNLAVTLSGQVLIVINNGRRSSSICFFDVYKMDPKSLEWRKINSIGDEALLFDLGITVAAKDGVLKNCIYFYTAVPYQSRGSFVRNADSGIRVYHIRTKNVVQVYQPALTASSPISFRWVCSESIGKIKPVWSLQSLVDMNSLVRRKQVDSVHLIKNDGPHQLAKKLSAVDLVAIGVGTTIGAGVYILVGTVAREHTGPALAVSFFIAGVAAALSACCYAELASRCPSAGSAYHYAYICLGEGIAWLVGWALVLDYTIGGSAIARGITPNLASFFGGLDKLPVFLARQTIPGVGIVVDPCAALLIMIVTILLCFGIKESSLVQAIVTSVNVCTLVFIIVVGGYLAFKTGWVGYDLPSGYFPFGLNGILAGSAIVFFSYIGFDTVTSTAEEVKNPQRDLPLGIGIALLICCILYMLLSVVIVGLVPYYSLNPDTPISSAFGDSGMQWAAYILTTGAVTALCASLLGSLLAQPRIFMAMARDGLLPAFFSEISPRTQVPVKSTIAIGVLAAALAFFMDVAQLSEMVSVGTLMAFTAVAACVLVLRYVPPDGVPLASSSQNLSDTDESGSETENFLVDAIESSDSPLLGNETARDEKYFGKRRKIASWSIALVCIGVLGLASAASAERLPSFPRFTICGVSAVILLGSLITLGYIDEDEERHNFGHKGGFLCPFVPYLPVLCILINTYLIINIGAGTWIRVLVWLLIGSMIYLFYGRSHSLLNNAVCVPRTTCTRKTTDHLA
ncbi:unnamed protein product [Arabidopsis arenosa]|uniref:Cationic amino acid transporter C-terminal domain-containing protein n=1 Tax=Arabidopsis arenosa TaxID=38785 RepID=A0A8S1ZSD8_ARAAE|nr:unnamed protein product [Arabidopsis arenosa]